MATCLCRAVFCHFRLATFILNPVISAALVFCGCFFGGCLFVPVAAIMIERSSDDFVFTSLPFAGSVPWLADCDLWRVTAVGKQFPCRLLFLCRSTHDLKQEQLEKSVMVLLGHVAQCYSIHVPEASGTRPVGQVSVCQCG